jgi:hypothetical protein
MPTNTTEAAISKLEQDLLALDCAVESRVQMGHHACTAKCDARDSPVNKFELLSLFKNVAIPQGKNDRA